MVCRVLWPCTPVRKMRKTDGQTVKIDFNPSSSKSAYQDLPEEERQKNKDLSFILEKIMLATALTGK